MPDPIRALALEDDNGNTIPVLSLGANLGPLDITTSSDESEVIDGTVVMVHLTQPAHIYIGPAEDSEETPIVATTNDFVLPAGIVFAFKCQPTDIVSVIKNSAATGDGVAYVIAAGR